MALNDGYLQTSAQVRIGEATAITLATSATKWYPVLYCDRDIELLEAGLTIGHSTVVDAAPSTNNIVVEVWNMNGANSTKVVEATILGQIATATQILPDAYVTIATELGMGSATNSDASATDVIGFKVIQTNVAADKGIPVPIAHIRYRVID